MGYFKDFSFETDRSTAPPIISFQGGASFRGGRLLPVGQALEFTFGVIAGPIRLTVALLDDIQPERIRPRRGPRPPRGGPSDPGDPDAGIVEEFNWMPFTVTLHNAVGALVARWVSDLNGWHDTPEVTFEHVVDPSVTTPETWTCNVRNRGARQAEVRGTFAETVLFRTPEREDDIAVALLDRAYRVIIEALAPSARIEGNRLFVSFGDEISEHLGGDVLGERHMDLPDDLNAVVHLEYVSLEASNGRRVLDAMRARWTAVNEATQPRAGDPPAVKIAKDARRKQNDDWRDEWNKRVHDFEPAVRAAVAFSNLAWSYALDLKFYNLKPTFKGVLKDLTVDIYFAFNDTFEGGSVLVLCPAKFNHIVADIARSLGIVDELGEYVERGLVELLEPAMYSLGRYLAEALSRLLSQYGMVLNTAANGSAWKVRWALTPDSHLATAPPGPADAGPELPVSDPIGQIPADFIVHHPEKLPLLDQIETIVILMMENRSFDHMLGYLRHLPDGTDYEGFDGTESNKIPGRNVRLRPARDVMAGAGRDDQNRQIPPTAIRHSPAHDWEHVLEQIADGAMSGFASDAEKRPQVGADMVMTYYTDADLPYYYELAKKYAVCDHWFASHPGATWPNRWATITGVTPSLENPAIDDPRIGYYTDETIFSWLSSYGIEWTIFEGDLSFARTMNRHRLDSTRIRPLLERADYALGIGEGNTFWELAARGALPEVVFIEPNYSDLPPLSTANDDLAPVDLRRGQRLVQDIVTTLQASPQWQRTMFVITYDEHGGFFDHVPPPGTELGPQEWRGKVPRIHPDGADHLGVRVPAFVISPLVEAGSVCHEVLDHTSILKTILLRHRTRIHSSVFTSFGPRVNEAAHLGAALSDAATGGQAAQMQPPEFPPETENTPVARRRDRDDFPESMRRAFLPRARPRA